MQHVFHTNIRPAGNRSLPCWLAMMLVTIGLLAAAASSAQTLLLSDNFNSTSGGASLFNSTLATDQAGSLAPVTYTVAGYDQDYKIQHGGATAPVLKMMKTAIKEQA